MNVQSRSVLTPTIHSSHLCMHFLICVGELQLWLCGAVCTRVHPVKRTILPPAVWEATQPRC